MVDDESTSKSDLAIRCTRPRRHYGFSGFNVSSATAAGELGD